MEVLPFGQSENARLYELALEAPDWEAWQPGQFVMLRPPRWTELTWGRPFSICRVSGGALKIFFQVVGRGTERLARLNPGDTVTVWGPLGNGFSVDPDTPTLMLAGGIGLAPFVGLARRHPNPNMLRLVFGHRLPLDCYPYDSLAVRIRAEHHHEQRPEDLAPFLATLKERMAGYTPEVLGGAGGMVLACGPLPFLKTVQAYAAELDVRCELSLENRMACGVGACLGCVSKDPEGNRIQVCTRGPVFRSDRIVLDEEG